MENNYYTPDIEDIRVGYEYETENDPVRSLWDRVVIENLYDLEDFCKYNKKDNDAEIRVPYLTKEQIEAEGWQFIDRGLRPESNKYYNKKVVDINGVNRVLELEHHLDKKVITITYDCGNYNDCCFYDGYCKSINEFRYICKLLNIK